MNNGTRSASRSWNLRRLAYAGLGALLLTAGLCGCGAEKQDLSSGPQQAPNTPPGGGDPNEYARQMQENAKKAGGAGGGGMPRPGQGGGGGGGGLMPPTGPGGGNAPANAP